MVTTRAAKAGARSDANLNAMPTALLFLLASLLAPSLAVASEAQHLAVGHGVMVHPGADTGDTPPAYDDPAWTATDWRKLKFRDAVWVRTIDEVPPGFPARGPPQGRFLPDQRH